MLFLRRWGRSYDVVVDQVNTLGFLAPLLSPVPTVCFIHQLAADVWTFEHPGWVGRCGRVLESVCLVAYRRVPVITVSEDTRGDLARIGWRGACAVAPNGVDIPAAVAGDKSSEPSLVWLGRFGARAKRLGDALAAFALLKERFPAARLTVIGRGEPPQGVLPPGVAVLANASDAARDQALASAWLLWATSVREGWGRMVAEAAAQGTAAAVYRVPGLRESAEALAGVAVPADPVSLASATAGLLAKPPEELWALGLSARRRAASFAWSRTVDIWEDVLKRAAASQSQSSQALPPTVDSVVVHASPASAEPKHVLRVSASDPLRLVCFSDRGEVS